MNVFEAVKQAVTTRQAAEHYGIRVNRNGMCVCPFHNDKTPSMKVDRRFHCFGCQADGDVIDFVSRLHRTGTKGAALMLAQDFSIPYEDKIPTGRSRPRPKASPETPEQQFKRMERYAFRVLSGYYHLLRRWEKDLAPQTPEEAWNSLFTEALQNKAKVEYLLGTLLFSSMEERAALITEYGKEVKRLERIMAKLSAEDKAGRDRSHSRSAPPRSVEEVKSMLESTEKGGFRNSIRNCLTVFQCDPLLSGAIAYNLLTDRNDIIKPLGYERSTSKAITETDIRYIRLYLEETYGLTSEKKIADACELAAHQNGYHPVRDYLNSLPFDRSGNRRFLPVLVCPKQAEVHILEDEAASRAYISQMWAEAMEIYKGGNWKLAFSPEMTRYLKEHQRDFMPEDTKAGQILAFLDGYTGGAVCSKLLYKEALNHAFDEPKQWEIREINEIMNQCVTGWKYFSNPRMFAGYGRQKGWEREQPATDTDNGGEKTPDGFESVTEQMELPF